MPAIAFERVVDQSVGGILVFLAGLFSHPNSLKMKMQPNPKRVAFIKLWAIGDSIAALPAIKEYKRAHPRSDVSVICRSRNKVVFQGQQFIDKIIEIEPSNPTKILKLLFSRASSRYDIVFDFEPYLNLSALIARWIGQRRVGFASQARSRLYTDRIEFTRDQHMVESYLEFLAVINPTSSTKDFRGHQHKIHGQRYTQMSTSLIPLVLTDSDRQMAHWFLESHKLGTPKRHSKQVGRSGSARNTRKGELRNSRIAINATISESVKSREWPRERFAQLAAKITTEGGSAIFVGGKQDIQEVDWILHRARIIAEQVQEQAPKIKSKLQNGPRSKLEEEPSTSTHIVSAAGLLSIPQSAALIELCDAFVGNDSGPMHLSAAMGRPTIGLFGPNTPAIWRPYGPPDKMVALYHKTWCSPCIRNTDGVFPQCFNPEYQQCMKLINVKEVEDALRTVLSHAKTL